MLKNPTVRNTLSGMLAIFSQIDLTVLGLANGKMPSSTSTKAQATNNSSHTGMETYLVDLFK